MASVTQMLDKLEGMLGTKDLNDWETKFVSDVVEKVRSYKSTSILTGNQVEKIEQIHNKHFG